MLFNSSPSINKDPYAFSDAAPISPSVLKQALFGAKPPIPPSKLTSALLNACIVGSPKQPIPRSEKSHFLVGRSQQHNNRDEILKLLYDLNKLLSLIHI